MKKIMALAMSLIICITMTACSKVDEDAVVATVNGEEITVGEYQKTLSLYKQSIEAMYGESIWETEIEEGKKYKVTFKETIMKQILEMEVIYQEAKKKDLLASEEEIDKAFKELKEDINADEAYAKNLEDMGIDDEFLKEQQAKEMALLNYNENFEKNNEPSEDEINKYYEENKEKFYKDEVEASHILIKTTDDDGKALSDEKKEEAKKKIEGILEEAKSGADFAELAKEHSDDGSAQQGGELGFFGKGMMVEPFEKAAFALQPGEISEVVETQYGYHIIKVTDKIDEQLTVEDSKEDIKVTLLNEKYSKNIEDLYNNAKIEKKEDIIKDVEF